MDSRRRDPDACGSASRKPYTPPYHIYAKALKKLERQIQRLHRRLRLQPGKKVWPGTDDFCLYVSTCQLRSPVFPALPHENLPCLRWLGQNDRAISATARLQRRPNSPKVPARRHHLVHRTTLFPLTKAKSTSIPNKIMGKTRKAMGPQIRSLQPLLSPI